MVDGVAINSCLGDLYSVNWMEDSDTKAGQAERLGDQFLKVKAETNKSHCLEYGTQDFKWTDHAHDYQGHAASEATDVSLPPSSSAAATAFPKIAVDSRDIELWLAKYAYMRATGEDARRVKLVEYEAVVARREAADARFARVFGALASSSQRGGLGSPGPEAVHACERRVIATAERRCGRFDEYSLKFTQPLVESCRAHAHEHVAAALAAAC
jgi:legumain